MKFCILFFFLFSVFFTLTAQQKQAITHERMWLLKRVGAPAVSPDGRWVIFSVTEPAYEEKDQVTDIWIAPFDGTKAARRLTAAKGGESGYTWSPDGSYIAFSAKRDADEVSQIYLLNMTEGGDAQRFTKLSSGASSPRFSPDGAKILFQSAVYPKCFQDSLQKKAVEERKKIKHKAYVYDGFPVRNWDKWIDEKQAHIYVQDLNRDSSARNLFQSVAISTEAGFKYGGNAIWTPDGLSIVFDATQNANTGAYEHEISQLYIVSSAGSDARKLTDMKRTYQDPRFTPDGKYLLCMSSKAKHEEVFQLDRLTRFEYPAMTGEASLSDSLDLAVTSYFAEGDQIIMTLDEAGRQKVYKMPILGGKAELLDQKRRGCTNRLSAATAAAGVWAATYESSYAPPEIVALGTDGTQRALSFFNRDSLDKLDLGEVFESWHTNANGKKIRSLVVKPANFQENTKYPLFVVMHGGPASAYMDAWSFRWNYHLLAAPGYVLLLTDYTGSTGYGEAFAQAIKGDPFEGPALEIRAAADTAIQRYSFIDASRQAAGGASYGGHLANWMQATTTHYKCLISHAGLMNSVSQWGSSDYIYGRELMNGGVPWSSAGTWQTQNPITRADRFKTPMLITIGELDFRVPINNSLESWHVHQRLRIPSKLIVFPEENHWINKGENSRFFYAELAAWLKKYM
jgi:dipeptidyl aminopeptidase/acylaminoacyl peptidase